MKITKKRVRHPAVYSRASTGRPEGPCVWPLSERVQPPRTVLALRIIVQMRINRRRLRTTIWQPSLPKSCHSDPAKRERNLLLFSVRRTRSQIGETDPAWWSWPLELLSHHHETFPGHSSLITRPA